MPLQLTQRKSLLKSPGFISSAIVIAIYLIMCIFYKISLGSDDVAIQNILCGNMTGTPDGHVIFINYMLCFVISSLYKILPIVNWYSFILVCSITLSLCTIIYSTLKQLWQYNIKIRIIGIISCIIICMYLFQSFMVTLSFTNIAAISGIALFYYLYLADNLTCKDILIICSLYIFMSLRTATYIQLLPFILVVVVFRFIQKKNNKSENGLYIGLLILSVICCIIEFCSYTGIYSNLKELNEYEAQIDDFWILPIYEDHTELYNDLGMDYDDYRIMQLSYGLSDFFNIPTMRSLAEEVQREIDVPLTTRLRQMKNDTKYMISHSYSVFFWIIEIFTVLVGIILILCSKKIINWFYAFCILGGALLEMLYLIYYRRLPKRVTFPILYIVLFMCIAYFIKNHSSIIRSTISHKLFLYRALILVYVILGIILFSKVFKSQISYAKATDKNQSIRSYFLENSANTYWLKRSFGDPLTFINAPHVNYYKLPGWLSETPHWNIALDGQYPNKWDAIANRKDMYFLLEDDDMLLIEQYLSSKGYDVKLQFETLTLDDQTYTIWRFE